MFSLVHMLCHLRGRSACVWVWLNAVGALWWTTGLSQSLFRLLASCQLNLGLWDKKVVCSCPQWVVSFELCVSVVVSELWYWDFKGFCWETWVWIREDAMVILSNSETVLVSVLHSYCPLQSNHKPALLWLIHCKTADLLEMWLSLQVQALTCGV